MTALDGQALGVAAVKAQLEREYGSARVLPPGPERDGLIDAFGVFHRCAVIDCGDGKIATVGPRGGGLQIHDLRKVDDGCC
jgi:hypothetical protein